MKLFRRLGFALWLALALVAGQHLALAHELGHATEKLAHKQDSKPAPSKCDQHIVPAQFAGAAPVHGVAPQIEGATVAAPCLDAPSGARHAPAYRAQAPPQPL